MPKLGLHNNLLSSTVRANSPSCLGLGEGGAARRGQGMLARVQSPAEGPGKEVRALHIQVFERAWWRSPEFSGIMTLGVMGLPAENLYATRLAIAERKFLLGDINSLFPPS